MGASVSPDLAQRTARPAGRWASEHQVYEVMSQMTGPIQRAWHSSQPEGQGNVNAPVDHFDAQRDLWEFLLPLRHAQSAAQFGGGVLEGLRVSGTLDSPGLTVSPGLALDGGGRLVALTVSADAQDLRVRLQPPSEGGSTLEGLAAVGQDGVALDTQGHSGERFVVLDWGETRIRADERTFYRLTPWLRLEPEVDPAGHRVVLARVALGTGAEQGMVKELDATSRVALPSFRDGLILQRSARVASPLAVEHTQAAGLWVRDDGGLDVGIWRRGFGGWQTALSVDGQSAHVGIGTETPSPDALLDVAGTLAAREVNADSLIARAGNVESLSASKAELDTLDVRSLSIESRRLPIIRGGRTDPATTPWEQHDQSCLKVTIDTRSARFPEAPLYFASLAGDFIADQTTGASAIQFASSGSFQVYVRRLDDWAVSVDNAREWGWYINWVGIIVR